MLRILAALALFAFGAPAAAQDYEPTPAQASGARAAVDAYIAATERGDIATVRAMQAGSLNDTATEAQQGAQIQQLNSALGATVARQYARVVWYHNSPNAPRPGTYAAFDMVGRFTNTERYCGSVIAYQPPGGEAFFIVRVEQFYMSNAAMANTPSAEDVWREAASTHCPGWQPAWQYALSR